MSIREGIKDSCMCFKSDKKWHFKPESKEENLKFYITRFNVLIPILVSSSVFFTEVYSVYYVTEKTVDFINILRLFNTTFIPTHIATTVLLLYQHFSLVNYYNNSSKKKRFDEMDLKVEYVSLTVISTFILTLSYLLFSFKVGMGNQVALFFMQGIYMVLLWKYCLRDKIVIYDRTIRNVVSF